MNQNKINILIFRTVRITDFGFIIKSIKSKYKDSNITIMTKEQNYDSFKYIDNVDQVLFYNTEPISYSKFNQKKIDEIKSKKFDLIIIPHNGFIDAYDNVLNFSKKIFKNSKIIFFQLPDNFIEYKFILKTLILKKMLIIVSIILTIPVFIIYTLTLVFKSLFTSDRKQY